VYRNLEPVDKSLPSLEDVWQETGLDAFRVPRKTEQPYAAAVYRFLQAAQKVRGGSELKNLLVVGDTRMNDGTAAINLGQYLPQRCFIGADKLSQESTVTYDSGIMTANRWESLGGFYGWVQAEGMEIGEHTVVVFDMDKTMLGARGRNSSVIDAARVAAVQRTVEETLPDFDEAAFRAVYDRLNTSEYHPFTTDNQDYLAYISLMVMAGVYEADSLWADIADGKLSRFGQFVEICQGRRADMRKGVEAAHDEVYSNVKAGDPTPFKSFRYREYHTTIESMDFMPDDTPKDELLRREITITGEVVEFARHMLAMDTLTFGISDKPDEASIPPADLATEGYEPIHRVRMKVTHG
jgi:hypothetical protein